MTKKQYIYIAIAATAILIAIGIFILVTNNKTTEPEVTKEPSGTVISPQQIEDQKLYNKETMVYGEENGSTDKTDTNTGSGTVYKPTTSDFLQQIDNSGAIGKGTTYGIVNTKNPLAGWWVVNVKLTMQGGLTQLNATVFKETGDPRAPLSLYAGPSTDIPEEKYPLPKEVRAALWD